MGADSFVALVGDAAGAVDALMAPLRRRLAGAGWSRCVSHPFLEVYAPSDRLRITAALDGHGVLIGEMFDNTGRAASASEGGALACRSLDAASARRIIGEHWGRYVLVRRTGGDAAILRDPSGAIEAVCWRRSGVTVVASSAAPVLDPLLPEDLALDWEAVSRLVSRGGEYRHDLALDGLTPIAGGELRTVGAGGSRGVQIWRPADVYRRGRGRPPELRSVVQMAVRSLAGDHTWVAEVSGGLDSAIVAASLETSQRNRVAAWVNHYVEQPEGDERIYARAVLAREGHALTEVRREGLSLSAERLARTADAFRPATNDIDTDYNDDIAARVREAGAWGSLTGQGGDAVFFQMPSPLIAFDEIQERGVRARPAAVHRIARWTRRSLWPWAWSRAFREHRRSRADWDHPWLDDLRSVPPAKALQISILAFCQTFQGQAARSRRGVCVNPLLSQPVMEAGLSWSTVDLTWGGRDRAAARNAFQDVLPPSIYARRSKGELGAFYGEAAASNLPFLRDYLLGGALAQAGLLDDLETDLSREALLWRGGFSRLLTLALTEAWVRRWTARLEARSR
ncbi:MULTISPECIES: asparagine synthase-related protein [Brevundimonas]|uniref:asparagine synthase-related protein n=1 Tax=Brevundimonas TaxID=41275 RepID=UPI0025C40C2E|nr:MULTISPECIES: asparagine synthase-related protein [Brevundimonas]